MFLCLVCQLPIRGEGVHGFIAERFEDAKHDDAYYNGHSFHLACIERILETRSHAVRREHRAAAERDGESE